MRKNLHRKNSKKSTHFEDKSLLYHKTIKFEMYFSSKEIPFRDTLILLID